MDAEADDLAWTRVHASLAEDEDLDSTERACDTLLMCIVTVMNHGLRNGGGVGDILRKPSKDVSTPHLESTQLGPCLCLPLQVLLLAHRRAEEPGLPQSSAL